MTIFLAVVGLLIAAGVTLIVAMVFRRVVPPSEVHIVQTARGTYAYGAAEEGMEVQGNSYYEWPSWLPFIGVQVRDLPLSVFQLELDGYEAYDKDKVPFMVDVVAFFRIDRPAIAAGRIANLNELHSQLSRILQGSARSILAKHDLEQILVERATFGEMFTKETEGQLDAWGVSNVKNIELMDVRDAHGSKNVSNIMAKKASHIEMDSRREVAKNQQAAQEAEIEAKQAVLVRNQEAEQAVAQRAAQKDREVGIATEQAKQEIQTQAKITKEREMAVIQVEKVRAAEIQKQQQIVVAEQERATAVLLAEGEKQKTILEADGTLEAAKRDAEGIQARGTAQAKASELAGLAVVAPQMELAKQIGQNKEYQVYLVQVRQIEASEKIGVEQAKALSQADVKVIANAGRGGVGEGMKSIRSFFTPEGATDVAGSLEALAQSDIGRAVVDRLTGAVTSNDSLNGGTYHTK